MISFISHAPSIKISNFISIAQPQPAAPWQEHAGNFLTVGGTGPKIIDGIDFSADQFFGLSQGFPIDRLAQEESAGLLGGKRGWCHRAQGHRRFGNQIIFQTDAAATLITDMAMAFLSPNLMNWLQLLAGFLGISMQVISSSGCKAVLFTPLKKSAMGMVR